MPFLCVPQYSWTLPAACVDVPVRWSLDLGEEQEHFHSRKAVKILDCACLQLGVTDGNLWGFASAAFTQRPSITNSFSSRSWCPCDNHPWPVQKTLFVISSALIVFGGRLSLPLWQHETRCIPVCDTPVSWQCLAVIGFFKDSFLYLLGILIFPSYCFASYWFKGEKKKELKPCLVIEYWWEDWGRREVVEAFVPLQQKMENTEEEMWMCMARREVGEKTVI